MCARSLQSWLTVGDPVDCRLPSFSGHGDSPVQEYWSGLPCPLPEDLPDEGIEFSYLTSRWKHDAKCYFRRFYQSWRGKCCGSVSKSFDSLWPLGLQHNRFSCSSSSARVFSDSCPLSQWYHPSISFSVIPFSSSPQSFSASGSFLSWLIASGSQSIGTSASASVLPKNIQSWFPLGWTGLIPLPSKGLSGVCSNITVWKHQFFVAQPSLLPNSHLHIWLLEKP